MSRWSLWTPLLLFLNPASLAIVTISHLATFVTLCLVRIQMANLAFFVDSEAGHILSTLKLAKDLSKRSHNIWYFGCPDSEELVTAHGFPFRNIFTTASHLDLDNCILPILPFDAVSRDRVANSIEELKLNAFVTLSLFCAEAIALKNWFQKPVILLRNHFSQLSQRESCRQILKLRYLSCRDTLRKLDLVESDPGLLADQASLSMREIVLMPREIVVRDDSPPGPHSEGVYAGLMVDENHDRRPAQLWQKLPSRTTLVYCSLGSQAHRDRRFSVRLFQALIGAVADSEGLQLIVSTGPHIAIEDLSPAANTFVTQWAPQMEVLERADLMINHAGIGSVKECIKKGVPMIVCPLMRDQFACAKRMVELGVALCVDRAAISEAQFRPLIQQLITDRSFKERVLALRERSESLSTDLAAREVEATLSMGEALS